MTQELSALMDGELEPHEAERALRACGADEDQMRSWYLYHAIGETMRGQAPRALAMPADAFEKLKQQPTVIAPRRPVLEGRAARVVLAAAASVATVGVVGWLGTQGGAGPSALSTVAKTGAPSASIQPVASTTTLPAAVPALTVQEYLVAHRQMPTPELYRPVTNRTPAPAR
jgi:sigma-E factor negative regulatory protein RseA